MSLRGAILISSNEIDATGGRRLRRLFKITLIIAGVPVLASALLFDLVALSLYWKDFPETERRKWLDENGEVMGSTLNRCIREN